MKYTNLIIEKKEYVLLKQLIQLSGYYGDNVFRNSIKHLYKELLSARICDEEEMPHDVIRFNSFVSITSGEGWNKRFQLVLPNDSDIKKNKISILTPMGAAVMGYATGDTLVWEFPAGSRSLTIVEVEQE
ncbi:GreA/GreB family elongation factor [Sinomicrobium weinanense]|uniref:GreA/GreB family elongation factor n=1 Tax=Sinomicrobium weinanense TaxID=2842200 RepID=A0A926JSQ9_9FLAO|nr:GreA/GreB family elongation factor [Sinomicrobium weinanense]MBC9796820.1 GreA/GreB family elongation factor [Sinomicrobium weinanense]MBU3123676.1 GreA/GreB family elongation factor [Sinomicrobium weinanense]